MTDVTWCVSEDCPSEDCRIHVRQCKAQTGELVSMADFSGTCRYYIGWVLGIVNNGARFNGETSGKVKEDE